MADEVKVTDALNVGADQLLKVADGTLDGMIDTLENLISLVEASASAPIHIAGSTAQTTLDEIRNLKEKLIGLATDAKNDLVDLV
jgi:hypothetical protein